MNGCVFFIWRGSVSCQLLITFQPAFIPQSRNDLATWFLHQTKEQSILTNNNSGHWIHALTYLHFHNNDCLYYIIFPYQLSTSTANFLRYA